ncbi:MAG: FosX/FosE/FosI family fosfomycin resistance hydrolase [Deltaproteobacteria bacterium]|nr:FosX/FosE/FosI family fosfomycin resistance hydrolase [Deltaproteobacteria bacterium]
MIEGLSHITFIVKDLDRTSDFMKTVFDAKEVYSSGEKRFSHSREKFFLVNGLWFAIMEGESLNEKTYNHVALKVNKTDLKRYTKRVLSLGLKVMDDRSRIDGEGKSLYFYDYDNHLFELHTGTLEERLEAYQMG